MRDVWESRKFNVGRINHMIIFVDGSSNAKIRMRFLEAETTSQWNIPRISVKKPSNDDNDNNKTLLLREYGLVERAQNLGSEEL